MSLLIHQVLPPRLSLGPAGGRRFDLWTPTGRRSIRSIRSPSGPAGARKETPATRRITTLLTAILLPIVALAGSSSAPAVAATEPVTDLAVVHIDPVAPVALAGRNLRLTGWVANLGPDALVGDSLDVTYSGLEGMNLRRQRCTGVSPDTPFCEFGEVPVGQQEGIILTGRVPKDSTHVSVTFCTSHEAEFINDPNPANNCMTKSMFVVG